MAARVIVGCFVLALGGCSVLFDGSDYETGSDASVEDAGPACDLGGDDECCSWSDCANPAADGPFCVITGGRRTCELECEEDPDCAGFPAGEACVSDGVVWVCGCGTDADCEDAAEGPFCIDAGPVRVCGQCRDNLDCGGGATCQMGFCEFCTPDAVPICGSGGYEDCNAPRWMSLEQPLGAQEVGVAGTYMAPGTFRGATDLSVVMAGDGLVYVAALTSGGPRIYRSADGPLVELTGPSGEIDCGDVTNSGFTSVEAMRLAADGMGRVLLAIAGGLGGTDALALFSLRLDDSWMVTGCRSYDPAGTSSVVGIAIAPEAAVVAALWEQPPTDSDVQWLSAGSSPDPVSSPGSAPYWIGGSGDLIVGRNMATAGMPSVWFLDGDATAPFYPGGSLTAAFAGRGAFASATPVNANYGHLIGNGTNPYLLRGQCSSTSPATSCPEPSLTTLDGWPSATNSLYAAADLAGTYMVIANVGPAPVGVGGEEVQLSGVPYTGDVPRPDAGPGRFFAPVFGDLDGGVEIDVLDVAVDAFRDDDTSTDHSDVAVAFLVDNGTDVNLGVRVMMLCDFQ